MNIPVFENPFRFKELLKMRKYRIQFTHVSGHKMYFDVYAITLSEALKDFEDNFIGIARTIHMIKEI